MKKWLCILFALLLTMSLLPITAFAEVDLSDSDSMIQVSLPVKYGQTDAREMLDYINNFRVGSGKGSTTNPPQVLDSNGNWIDCPDLKPLKYDYELEKAAMKRAAEIAISFSHTRPNGYACITAGSEIGCSVWGENIAAGYGSAYSTFLQFREDDEPYELQGHRRLMLHSDFTAVGIGHVVYNGMHFWVHNFGNASPNSSYTPAQDGNVNVPVDIRLNQIQTGSNGLDPTVSLDTTTMELPVGQFADVPQATIHFWLRETWPMAPWGRKPSGIVDVQWNSSDDSVVTVEGNQIKAISPGTVQLSGNVLGETLRVTVEVPAPPTNEWQQHDGIWYWYDQNGQLATGWQWIDGAWYYFNGVGQMQTGWQWIDSHWFYLNSSGQMQKGWQWINSAWYYFDGSGVMAADTWIDNNYVNGSGVWIPGAVRTGWQWIDGAWYYFNDSGVKQTGWQQIDGTWFYLDGSGHMLKGWQQIGGNWFYLDGSGHMLTGWQQIGGNWFYLDGSGHMLTGWQWIGSNWFYLNGSGHMLTGWQWIDGNWFYLNSSGHMMKGWQWIDSHWFYLNSSGHMQTGWQWIDSHWYYFYSNGAMAVNTTIDGCYVNGSGIWEQSDPTPEKQYSLEAAQQAGNDYAASLGFNVTPLSIEGSAYDFPDMSSKEYLDSLDDPQGNLNQNAIEVVDGLVSRLEGAYGRTPEDWPDYQVWVLVTEENDNVLIYALYS